jgi:Tol biopolymer transport system component
MRTIAATMTAVAVVTIGVGGSSQMVTVVQHDPQRSPSEPPSVAVSADGRFVAFVSYARLAPADTNDVGDIYVLDRASGQMTLESLGPNGGASAANSDHPAISGDGTMLAYETCGHVCEVRLRDRREGRTRVIGPGRDPAISADGRVVAFASMAPTLVAGPDATEKTLDVYLYDVATGHLRPIRVASGGLQPSFGASVTPSVSADGRYIAFTSIAGLPSTGRSPHAPSDIYVHDTRLNTTTRVSEGWRPAISADGRYVAFVSSATNLVVGDRNRSPDVFLADLKTGSIELVSRSARGGSANGTSVNPALSADARFVVFQSDASDLVCARHCAAADEDVNLLPDIFVLDRRDHAMTRLSADAAGGWMEPSIGPALDAAGEVIAFSSRHPIDAADVTNDFDLFIVHR